MIDCLVVIVSAFLLEVVDAGLGMGYGTILTPLLLVVGFDPLQAVPAVLVSQLVGDFCAAFFHHEFKNVNLSVGSKDFKIGMTLALLSVFGAIVAVLTAVRLSKFLLSLYIGILVAAVGIVVLAARNKNFGFSWPRLAGLGSLAAFNKGISGGGYGPIVISGQILTGVETKSAIGITSLAEGFTCIVAVLMYFLVGRNIDWLLPILLSIGVAFATPVAAFLVSKIESPKLKLAIGTLSLLLGLLTIYKAL